MKRLESYWYGKSYFIHILDKKTIQNGILPTGWHLGPVWLDQNLNRFQNPLRLFRQDFLKPNPDSWNHETSPGAGCIGFKMADGDGQVSVETSDYLF